MSRCASARTAADGEDDDEATLNGNAGAGAAMSSARGDVLPLAALYLRAEETTVDCVRSVRALSVGLNNVAQSPTLKRARIFRSALVLAIKTS